MTSYKINKKMIIAFSAYFLLIIQIIFPSVVYAEENNSDSSTVQKEIFGVEDNMKQEKKDETIEKKEKEEDIIKESIIQENSSESEKIKILDEINSVNEIKQESIEVKDVDEKVLENYEKKESEIKDSETKKDTVTNKASKIEINKESSEEFYSLEKNRESAIKIMEEEKKEKSRLSNYSDNGRSHTSAFIDTVAPFAVEMGNKYSLYPSVIIAQAILESGWGGSSLSNAPNYNLFGIKAENGYKGNFVTVKTKEWVKDKKHKNGGYFITISANFRKYSSYRETFEDHALFLKKNRYKDVWLNNAGTYQDATKALSSAGYATDPEYSSILNNIIDTYSLQNYDLWQYTDYNSIITHGNISIDSLPWGIRGSEKITSSSKYIGTKVKVTKKTHNGAYSFIKIDGKEVGWINTKALVAFETTKVNYNAIIKKSSISIDTIPYGMTGYKKKSSSSYHLGKELQIVLETKNGKYAKVASDGKEIGWINKTAIQQFKTKTVDYTSVVVKKSISIDSLPWGIFGNKRLNTSSNFIFKDVQVTRETQDGKYAFIVENGNNLGWINKNSIYKSSFKTSYHIAILTKKGISIDTLPWGAPGYSKVASTSNYIGKEVEITKELSDGSYAYIIIDGKEIGWVNKSALRMLKTDIPSHTKTITKKSISIDSLPWGTPGHKKIASSTDYFGKEVIVTKETSDRKYVHISINGNNIGWINKNALY